MISLFVSPMEMYAHGMEGKITQIFCIGYSYIFFKKYFKDFDVDFRNVCNKNDQYS